MLLWCCICHFTFPATGFDGEQPLAVQLLQFGRRKRQIISGEPLPLSHKSYLSWLGFSAEGESRDQKTGIVSLFDSSLLDFKTTVWLCSGFSGTPCYVDSEGVVRILNRALGNTWTPVCNTRETCKSKSDHYWVVGVHENPQQLRWCLWLLCFSSSCNSLWKVEWKEINWLWSRCWRNNFSHNSSQLY